MNDIFKISNNFLIHILILYHYLLFVKYIYLGLMNYYKILKFYFKFQKT